MVQGKREKITDKGLILTGPGLNFFNPLMSPPLKNGWATS